MTDPQKLVQTTWEIDTTTPSYSSLSEDIQADVAIIGGGITGVTTAYMLAKAGKRVVLLEKDTLGMYATGKTTAIITRSIDIDTKPLIKAEGEEGAKRILESHQHAIDMIEKMVEENTIDCEFMRDTNYMYGNTDEDLSSLQEEYDSLQELKMPAEMTKEAFKGFVNAGGVTIPNQAKFHPLKYLFGLAEAAQNAGAQIYMGSEVTHIEHDEKYKGPFTLETSSGGKVTAEYVLSAVHLPFEENQPLSLYFQKGRYVTYMMEVEIPHGIIEEGTYEDTYVPYHYFRVDAKKEASGDRLIIGGEDHRHDIKVNPDKNIAALEEYLEELLPEVDYTIIRKWSGPIIEPTDGFAFIGPVHKDDKMFYATGYSGTGMTYGTLAGEIITGLVTGNSSQYEDLYQGFSTKGMMLKGMEYAQELVGGAVENTLGYKHSEVEGDAEEAEYREKAND